MSLPSKITIAKLIVLGAIGGWLGGVCINTLGTLIAGLTNINSLKGSLVGIVSMMILSIPWGWSINSKTWWFWGGLNGYLYSILTVLFYFLLWPYDEHGQSDVLKTVMTIAEKYPLQVFGIGGLAGVYASALLRLKMSLSFMSLPSKITIAKLIVLGAIGGWLGGVCINTLGTLIAGLTNINSLKGSLVGIVSMMILSIPWGWSINSKDWWFWGGNYGYLCSILTVLLYFLIWPYDGHGRGDIHKTVLAIVAAYPLPVFGIGGLTGVYASAWLRPQKPESLLFRIAFPLVILGGLATIIGASMPEEVKPKPKASPEQLECCKLAYQAFVEKVGVSYAIYKAEEYCETQCEEVNNCLNHCMDTKEQCSKDANQCKEEHRACVLSCPN